MRSNYSRFCRRAVVAGILLLLIAAFTSPHPPLLIYNRTPSVPVGIYVWCGNAPRRGDLVAFPLPTAAHAYAQARGDSPDVLLLKPVLAAVGDRVSTLNNELRINGAFLGAVANTDSAGRSLPRWRVARTLKAGELFVGSTRTVHSFDSRFFGPIHASHIVGVYRPLWLHSIGETSAPSASAPPTAASQSTPRRGAVVPNRN